MMLAFVLLWVYMSYSQYIIIWSGDLPSETSFYLHRQQGGWKVFAWGLIVLHFALPFLLLLFGGIKRRAGPLSCDCRTAADRAPAAHLLAGGTEVLSAGIRVQLAGCGDAACDRRLVAGRVLRRPPERGADSAARSPPAKACCGGGSAAGAAGFRRKEAGRMTRMADNPAVSVPQMNQETVLAQEALRDEAAGTFRRERGSSP